MYTITVQNPTGEYTIHNPYDDTLKVVDPVLELELNHSGTLTFTISPTNPNAAQILPMASEVYVYRDNAVYWVGRPIQIEQTFDMMDMVTCEGVLGYLLDTQVPPFDFTGTRSIKGAECVKTFLTRLVSRHNSALSTTWEDQRKKFTVGDVTIYDSNNNIARSAEDYATTLETINEKLLETHGGYLRVRYSGNTRYIDYIDTFGDATQPISFGSNLLDLTSHVKTEEIATTVIPLGAQIEGSDKRLTLSGYTPTTAVLNRITASTHGGGLRTVVGNGSFSGWTGIYDKAGENAHGRVYVVQTWDDVTLQSNLALKAAEYIGKISVLGKTLDLSAVDLAQIDVDYHSFNLGQMATVVSIPHDINAAYQITQMSVDLYNPANSTLTLGGEMRTFTFDNTKKQAEIVTNLETGITDAVRNANALLSGGLGGYLIIRQDESGQPYEILIMNQATEEAATNCVRINKNGLGFGRKATGQSAASWNYRNAWTIDGNLIADFITTGTLNANLLKTGTISDPQGNTKINLSNGTLSMKKGSINLGSGAFAVSDAGTLTMKKGSISLGGGKFSVNNSGELKATYGEIGGWQIMTRALANEFNVAGRDMFVSLSKPYRTTDDIFSVLVGSSSAFAVRANGTLYSAPVNTSGQFTNTGFRVSPGRIELEAPSIYFGGLPYSSHSGNLYIHTDGRAYYGVEASSSRKIKHDIKPVTNDDLKPERLYDAEVIQYKYNDDFISEDDPNRGKDLIGFVVEDLHEVYPVAVADDAEDSKDWTWSPYKMIPPMLKLIQDQKKQIDDLEARVSKLEALITKGE